MQIREPYVAGSFYPADPVEIKRFCRPLLKFSQDLKMAKAILLPHAGYVYSGPTACRVLSEIQLPKRILMLGPDHQGRGGDFSLDPKGEWRTPLGSVSIDEDLSGRLLRSTPHIKQNPKAHRFEHSLEVMLPLLQLKIDSLLVTPILVGTGDLEKAGDVSLAIAEVLSKENEPVLVLISNDMNHYEDDKTTRQKDQYALKAIEHLDADRLAEEVHRHRITMCGFIPTYMLLKMKEKLKIQKATLIDYSTSADNSGEKDRVVGYAGFTFQ